jgi:hypothetical protein
MRFSDESLAVYDPTSEVGSGENAEGEILSKSAERRSDG